MTARTTIGRRALCAAPATLLLPQASPPLAPAEHPDAALLAACERMRKTQQTIDNLPSPIRYEDLDRLGIEIIVIMREIAVLPAITEAGLRAKADAAHTALMSQVHTFLDMDWRDEATANEFLALVTLREVAAIGGVA